jgi:hypothetical protein
MVAVGLAPTPWLPTSNEKLMLCAALFAPIVLNRRTVEKTAGSNTKIAHDHRVDEKPFALVDTRVICCGG